MPRPCPHNDQPAELFALEGKYTKDQCAICWHFINTSAYRARWGGDISAEQVGPPQTFLQRAISFTKAVGRHIVSGCHKRTEAEISAILEICKSCSQFNGRGCNACGCNCSAQRVFFNKLALKSEHCPLGKWHNYPLVDLTGKKWAVIVTTCPMIRDDKPAGSRGTLPLCLNSLLAAGWSQGEITVYAEPESEVPGGFNTVWRQERFGLWNNLMDASKQALASSPDYIMWVEDDTVLADRTRQWLEDNPWPQEAGVVSLFRIASQQLKNPVRRIAINDICWTGLVPNYDLLKRDMWLWGSNALVFDVATLKQLVDSPPKLGGTPDFRVGMWTHSTSKTFWVVKESKAQHLVSYPSGHPKAGEKVPSSRKDMILSDRMSADTFQFAPLVTHQSVVASDDFDVTLITPTGDRHDCFRLLEKRIGLQLNSRVQWIVVDDGRFPIQPSLGQEYIRRESSVGHTLCANFLAALSRVRANKLLIIEDDDWYSSEYIKQMCQLLDNHDLVGERAARYYHIARCRYKQFVEHRHASLCRTGCTSKVYPLLAKIASRNNQSIDLALWNEFLGDRDLFTSEVPWSVSIKAMPGRVGSTHGDRSDYSDDADFEQLQKWTNEDTVNDYKQFALFKQKIVVYSAIFGGYDNLKVPRSICSSSRYVCFSDSLQADLRPWEVIRQPETQLTHMLENRKYKLQPHTCFPDADWTIYMDGAFQLKSQPYDILAALFRDYSGGRMQEFYVNRNSINESWSQEVELVRKKRFARSEDIDRQAAAYKAEGFIDDRGTFSCGFLVRRDSEKMREVGRLWWDQLMKFTPRDQIALPYVLWKTNPDVCVLSHKTRSKFTSYHKHLKPRPVFSSR